MKILSIITTVFFLVLLGCQENSFNPVETPSMLKEKPTAQQTIKLCCELKDRNSSICNLNGRVDYFLEVIKDMMTPLPTNLISLRINFQGMLCNKLGMQQSLWSVDGKSNDVVQVSEEGILLLDKYYTITNRNDVVLHVKYLVSTEGMGVSSIDLKSIEDYTPDNY